jgi:hypothetical protein
MKSLKMGASSRLRFAAAAVFAALLLICSPALAVDSYDYGEVELGSQANVALDIESISPSDMTFGLELLPGSPGECGFSLPTAEVTVPEGGIAQIEVGYSPTGLGTCSQDLTVTYLGSFVVHTITLTGTGIEKTAAEEPTTQSDTAGFPRWASPLANLQVNGKPLGEQVQACFDSADNHGQAVSCVAHLAAELRKERAISRYDAWEMKDYAVKSKYHSHKKHMMQKKAAYREIREKHARRWSNWD